MRRCLFLGLLVLSAILSIVAACTPQVAPPPATKAPTTPSQATVPSTNLPSPTSQDIAWQKIIDAAKKEGKVNAYSFNWVGDIGIAVSKAFKEKYGITLEVVTGRGAEFVERIKTEKRMGQIVGDVTEGSSLHTHNMRLEGLLTSVVDDVPVFWEKNVWYVDVTAIDPQYKANLVWRILEYAPYINTKLVKPEDVPQYWKDLLDPKWKGKMSLTEPNISAGPYENIVVLMENKVWDEEYVKALYRQNLRYPLGLPDETLALARGDTQLIVRGTDASTGRYALEGAPIQAIDMKDGMVVSTASIGVVANGPNPNATRVFMNWIFGPEGISVAGKLLGNKMVRKDVPDFRPKAVQANITRPFVESIEQLDKATKLYREKWFDKTVGR